MSNPEHLKILKRGMEVWNKWQDDNPSEFSPDFADQYFRHQDLAGFNLKGVNFEDSDMAYVNLAGADLRDANFSHANLRGANLQNANLLGARCRHIDAAHADFQKSDLATVNFTDAILKEAKFQRADLLAAILDNANLHLANFSRANLEFAKMRNADLLEANLSGADLEGVDLQGANLRDAHLEYATFVDVDLSGTNLSGSYVYGISAWDLVIDDQTEQKELIITPQDSPAVIVDSIDMAQLVYLILHNDKIRGLIDTIGAKGVLILGRFTPARKAVLDAIRDKLRDLGFVPMMFDFEKPTQRDFTETIKTLAGMSRFMIADISEPKCIPLELQAIVPDYAIPVVPIFHVQQGPESEEAFAMIRDLQKYKWVFEVLEYDSPDILLDSFEDEIVKPAKDMADSLLPQKAEGIRKRRLGK